MWRVQWNNHSLPLTTDQLNLLIETPTNHRYRLQEMFGVIHSISGLHFGVPMGASHAIGHQLGPLGVGHGYVFFLSFLICDS